MSTSTLSLIILAVLFTVIIFGALIGFFVKHAQYMREAPHKVKCVFFPQSGATYTKIIDLEESENISILKAPKGHKMPYYFYNKENTWQTRYPDMPFLGVTALQVQIATVWYYEENPEPITSHPEHPIATSSMIFASVDQAFALVVQELDAELQKTKKQLLDALQSKINKTLVYAGLGIILLAVLVAAYMSYTNGQDIKLIKEQVVPRAVGTGVK